MGLSASIPALDGWMDAVALLLVAGWFNLFDLRFRIASWVVGYGRRLLMLACVTGGLGQRRESTSL